MIQKHAVKSHYDENGNHTSWSSNSKSNGGKNESQYLPT